MTKRKAGVQTIEVAPDPAEQLCYCEHERKWHDACSKCPCPWFLTPGNEGPLKRWKADRRRRTGEKD